MERAPALIRAFPSFESEDYRALWIAAAASAVSMWSLIMARAWLALELADSGLAVGAVTFAAMAPWTLAPIAGALADRFDRARMIVIGRVLHLNFALILAYLAFSHSLEVWHLILLAFASGVAWAIENSAQNALLPNTVDKNSLLNAITLLSMANFGSRLVGPLRSPLGLAALGDENRGLRVTPDHKIFAPAPPLGAGPSPLFGAAKEVLMLLGASAT